MIENLIKKNSNTEIYVVPGDITKIPADAIMTAVNSEGMWFGGIDGAIYRVAGKQYHAQASKEMPLYDLQTIVAKGDKNQHEGEFDNVVFIIDDLKSSLDKIVYNGLEAANEQGYKKILVPAIRMGVMAGVVEKTPKETILKIKEGIENFIEKYGQKTSLENITFVVYNDPSTVKQLSEGL